MQPVTRSEIAAAARNAGLEGLPIEVHSSLSSFGTVEGGAPAVVEGLLDASTTVVVPTFSTAHYAMAQPTHLSELVYDRNALAELDREQYIKPTPRYETASSVMNKDMGAIPASILRRPDRVRGNHELNSFSAVGPLAQELIETQTSEDVYGPLREVAERDGFVVMVGVGLERMTLIHYAEQLAGRNLFKRWVADDDGNAKVVSIGSCSYGFERFAPVLQHIERRHTVGGSTWRVYPAAGVIELVVNAIKSNPEITRCSNEDCARCPDAVAGGPLARI